MDKETPLDWESCSWKAAVQKQLALIFHGKNVETLLRVFFFLDEETRSSSEVQNASLISASWKTLKATLESDSVPVFTRYAVCLAEETKEPVLNEAFGRTMSILYEEMMSGAEEPLPEDVCEGFALVRITDFDVSQCSAFSALAKAWNFIPLASQSEILHLITRIIAARDRKVIRATDGVVARCEDVPPPDNALVSTLLSFDSMVHVRQWWKGEISVRRCGKKIVDSTVSTAAGVAGAVGGAAVGVATGVIIGVVTGAVGGAVIGAKVTRFVVSGLCEKMTETLFGIPEEALENAYKFLDVDMTATNEEVNEAYRKLCLKHHPDKGGEGQEFILLQVHMGVIKAAREDCLKDTHV